MSRWELEHHQLLKTLIRVSRNVRGPECEHCGLLLQEAIKCMDKETPDIRHRSNDE